MAPRSPLSHVPPEEFVKARDALVRQLRERGENEEAKRIAALRRPSTALWVTNQLGGRAAKDVDALIDSTGRARKAQLHGGTDARRDAIRAEQLEHIARQAQLTADRAEEKAREARRAADESAARLTQLRDT